MKKIFIAFAGALMLAAPMIKADPASAPAPDLRNLLGGLAGAASSDTTASSGSGLGDMLGGVIGGLIGGKEVTVENVAGVYKYSEPAISFVSDDLLHKAGGMAASAAIKSKLQPYYQRAGMEKLEVTLCKDQTFQFELGRLKLSGTFAKDSTKTDDGNAFVFHFQAFKSFNIGSFDADLQLAGGQLIMTFDASKLITLVNGIAKLSGKSSLQSAAKLLSSYDGMRCGFALKKTGDAPATLGSPATDTDAAPAASDSVSQGSGLSGLFNAISNRRKK